MLHRATWRHNPEHLGSVNRTHNRSVTIRQNDDARPPTTVLRIIHKLGNRIKIGATTTGPKHLWRVVALLPNLMRVNVNLRVKMENVKLRKISEIAKLRKKHCDIFVTHGTRLIHETSEVSNKRTLNAGMKIRHLLVDTLDRAMTIRATGTTNEVADNATPVNLIGKHLTDHFLNMSRNRTPLIATICTLGCTINKILHLITKFLGSLGVNIAPTIVIIHRAHAIIDNL